MPTNIKIKLNTTEEILKARQLQKGGQAQRFMTSEVRRLCDGYVPMDSAILKNTALVDVDKITYTQPYSRYQYYGVSKNGKDLNYQHSPQRGKEWDKRMVADRGQELTESVAKYIGGKAT